MKLFIAGLPYDLDDAELMEILEKFGPVVSARVAMDKETGKSKGFGFAEMQNEADGNDVIEHLNNISLGKKPLVVTKADDRGSSGPKRPPSGNQGGGFNRGGSGSGGGFNRGGSGSGGGFNRGGSDRGGYNRNPGRN